MCLLFINRLLAESLTHETHVLTKEGFRQHTSISRPSVNDFCFKYAKNKINEYVTEYL